MVPVGRTKSGGADTGGGISFPKMTASAFENQIMATDVEVTPSLLASELSAEV